MDLKQNKFVKENKKPFNAIKTPTKYKNFSQQERTRNERTKRKKGVGVLKIGSFD